MGERKWWGLLARRLAGGRKTEPPPKAMPQVAPASVKAPDFINPVDGYTMVLIPRSTAVFGSKQTDLDAFEDEKPQFEAELPDYYLGLYCVTNRQYTAFLNAVQPANDDRERWVAVDGPCHLVHSGSGYALDDEDRYGDHPVALVSWYGAQAYCDWAGLRLPTELEWEKGARGTKGYVYPWGNDWNVTHCRHDRNRGLGRTCRVWDYPPGVSPWGCYNMVGNVLEWCADWYAFSIYKVYAKGDLQPPASGSDRVLRGADWYNGNRKYFRASHRFLYPPDSFCTDQGFRCARGL